MTTEEVKGDKTKIVRGGRRCGSEGGKARSQERLVCVYGEGISLTTAPSDVTIHWAGWGENNNNNNVFFSVPFLLQSTRPIT